MADCEFLIRKHVLHELNRLQAQCRCKCYPPRRGSPANRVANSGVSEGLFGARWLRGFVRVLASLHSEESSDDEPAALEQRSPLKANCADAACKAPKDWVRRRRGALSEKGQAAEGLGVKRAPRASATSSGLPCVCCWPVMIRAFSGCLSELQPILCVAVDRNSNDRSRASTFNVLLAVARMHLVPGGAAGS